jgi:hypothetical protein
MPAFLEAKLKTQAAEKGFSGKKAARYVYGAMNNLGAMRGSKETAKGKKMQAKHEAKTESKAPIGKMHKLSELL